MDFIKKIESQLDMPTAEKEQVLREITSHYNEVKEELITAGATELEAGIEAEKRVGEPQDVAARLNATHASASWKSAILCAVPFVIAALSYLLPAFWPTLNLGWNLQIIMLLGVTLVGIRELVLGRRAIWLSTWLAASLFLICHLLVSVTVPLTNDPYSVMLNVPFPAFVLLLFLMGMRVRRWRVFTVSVGLLYILSLTSNLLFPVGLMAAIGLLIVAARATFETHPCGSAPLASLFIFSVLMLIRILGMLLFIGVDSATEMRDMAAESLLYACPIVLFARAYSTSYKSIIALAAILAVDGSVLSADWKWQDLLFTLFASTCGLAVVMFPIWLAAFHSQRNRASIAQ